jgi:hypothetical protein
MAKRKTATKRKAPDSTSSKDDDKANSMWNSKTKKKKGSGSGSSSSNAGALEMFEELTADNPENSTSISIEGTVPYAAIFIFYKFLHRPTDRHIIQQLFIDFLIPHTLSLSHAQYSPDLAMPHPRQYKKKLPRWGKSWGWST